jgi:hypothetical protein
MTESDRCQICDVRTPSGDGTLCSECLEAIASASIDEATERALDMRVDEYLDRQRERRHARGEPPR